MRRLIIAVLVAAASVLVWAQPAGAGVTAAQAAAEKRVVQLVNAHRARAGCKPLRTDGRLLTAARRHSQDMARRRYVSHTAPGGVTPWKRMAAAGYRGRVMGENIAAGQSTAAAAVSAWMRSRGHRANILNCRFQVIGVGLATGGPYRYYWTQNFGG